VIYLHTKNRKDDELNMEPNFIMRLSCYNLNHWNTVGFYHCIFEQLLNSVIQTSWQLFLGGSALGLISE